jgi:hypothetical protein
MVRYYRHYSKKGRSGRTQSVADNLSRFLDKLDTTGGYALVQLWDAWDDLMGEMAHIARPLGHRGRKLVLAAEDPMVMQEAQFLAPMILEKINGYLGQEVFDKVAFELLNGRVPLDGLVRPEAPGPLRKLKKPDNLGGLEENFDPDSPMGRCYQAYRRMFDDK